MSNEHKTTEYRILSEKYVLKVELQSRSLVDIDDVEHYSKWANIDASYTDTVIDGGYALYEEKQEISKQLYKKNNIIKN
tara:strand:+ start:159 stop:395 length:237 start_codon:yes stop_codon:yes gene_type:complete